MTTTTRIAALLVRFVAVAIIIPGILAIPAQLIAAPEAFAGWHWLNVFGVLFYVIPGILLYRSSVRIGRWFAKGLDEPLA